MSSSRTAAATRARWAGTTPEQRREHTRKMRLVYAVKELAEHWHELDDEQRRTLSEAMAGGAR